jgi:hypothetical protein
MINPGPQLTTNRSTTRLNKHTFKHVTKFKNNDPMKIHKVEIRPAQQTLSKYFITIEALQQTNLGFANLHWIIIFEFSHVFERVFVQSCR